MTNHKQALSVSPLRSDHWDEDTPVIQGRPTKQGLPAPKFGDDVWDLSGIVFRTNAGGTEAVVDFRVFEDAVRRLTVKEIVMARLNARLLNSPLLRPLPLIGGTTAKQVAGYLRILYRFVDRQGVLRFADLTPSHLDTAVHEFGSMGVDPSYAAGLLREFQHLHDVSPFISFDGMSVPPWGGKAPGNLLGVRRRQENTTPRIDEETMGPLLAWALAYVDRFSDDIIAAHHLVDLDLPQQVSWKNADDKADLLKRWLNEQTANQRPLPSAAGRYRGRPNVQRICRLSGVGSSKHLPGHLRQAIDDVAAQVGLGSAAVYQPAYVIDETAGVWRDGLDADNVMAEMRHLVTACYIVCAYLSGMRDSEVQDLRVGCRQTLRGADGEVIRHKLRTRSFKGAKATGAVRTWVVIEPVHRGIDVLERLTERRRRDVGTDLLFIHLHGHTDKRQAAPSLKGSINGRISSFIEHVNTVLAPTLDVPGLPEIPKPSTSITTRQFRRTVAWHIANRPFGVVAGMIQYGHTSEIVFEGYAGNSESGFRAEVQAERELAGLADVVEMYDDFKRGVVPAGPMAGELNAEFEHIRATLGDFPGKIVDERRRDKMLKHLGANLYLGLMADYFFNPERAACLAGSTNSPQAVPVAGICDPHCPNACWLKRHLAVWEAAQEDAERLGRRNQISPLQREIVCAKASEYAAVIAQIKEAQQCL